MRFWKRFLADVCLEALSSLVAMRTTRDISEESYIRRLWSWVVYASLSFAQGDVWHRGGSVGIPLVAASRNLSRAQRDRPPDAGVTLGRMTPSRRCRLIAYVWRRAVPPGRCIQSQLPKRPRVIASRRLSLCLFLPIDPYPDISSPPSPPSSL